MIEQIAKTAHSVHLAYCKTKGLKTQKKWSEVDIKHKEVVYNSVKNILTGVINSVQESHNNFIALKFSQGWFYGEKYSIEKKTNPRLVPFKELTEEDRIKETLFFECVKSFM